MALGEELFQRQTKTHEVENWKPSLVIRFRRLAWGVGVGPQHRGVLEGPSVIRRRRRIRHVITRVRGVITFGEKGAIGRGRGLTEGRRRGRGAADGAGKRRRNVQGRRTPLDRLHLGRGGPCLVCIVDEVAPRTVRAEPDRVEGPAELRLVLRMTSQVPQFVGAVSELAFVTVFTRSGLLERPAKFCLISTGIDILRYLNYFRRFALRTIQFSM